MAITDDIALKTANYIYAKFVEKGYDPITFNLDEFVTDTESVFIQETGGLEVDGSIEYEKPGIQLIFQSSNKLKLTQQIRRVKNILITATMNDLKGYFGNYNFTGFSIFGNTIFLGKTEQGGYYQYSVNYILSKNGIGDDE